MELGLGRIDISWKVAVNNSTGKITGTIEEKTKILKQGTGDNIRYNISTSEVEIDITYTCREDPSVRNIPASEKKNYPQCKNWDVVM